MKVLNNEYFIKKFIASRAFLGCFAISLLSMPTLNASVVNTSTQTSYIDLQTAIDNASPGDTITISGTQIGNFIIDKDLTLKGGKDAVLDGNSAGTVLTIGTVSNVVVYLDQLTIQNGLATNGGGIFNQATTYLSHVKVTNNVANDDGGGIYNQSDIAHLYVGDSKIEYNEAGLHGGGIFNNIGGLTVIHSKIYHNTSVQDGGGIYSSIGIPVVTISNSKFKHNSAGTDGGAYVAENNETTFLHVKFKWNRAAANGGAVSNFDNSILTIEHCDFKKNTASLDGGGLYNYSGVINFIRSEVKHNTASGTGGGIFNAGLNPLNLFKTKVKHNNPNNIVTGGPV